MANRDPAPRTARARTVTAEADRFLAELAAADSPAIEERLREEFTALVRSRPTALLRDGGPQHLTASALVVDATGAWTALVWHRKGQFWVQPGGHLEEGETSFEAATRREVAEECGLQDLRRIGAGPAMLHRHDLPEAFGRCREHWDVQFLLATDAPATEVPLQTSEETPEVRWFRRGEEPVGVVPDLPGTLRRLDAVLAGADLPG